MKIDVITLHAVQNYGSVLQALATQKILEEHGGEVEIINYIREDVKYENILKARSGGNFLKKVILYPNVARWKKVFKNFCDKYLNLTENVYTTEEDFRKFPIKADMFCTGSDQVWNSKWNNGIIAPLYLNFAPSGSFKFALSASFGKEILTEDEVDKTSKYINEYKYISVREDSAKKILDEQYGYKGAVQLIDPTLMVTGEEWRKFANNTKKDEKYILIYNLNRSKEFDKYAKKLSKKTNLKLIRICNRYDQFYRPGKSVIIPEIKEFIRLIDNASYVLTDSFHATAFSMNMNTEVICVYPEEFGGRIKSFLNLTKTQQRHISNYTDFSVIEKSTNFGYINEVLSSERERFNDYLNSVFEAYMIEKSKQS